MTTERSVEQLRLIASYADALPAAIWVGRAPGGECVYVNREFERILGITPPDRAARGNYVGPYGVHLPSGERYPEDQMPYERAIRARAPVIIDDVVIHRHDGTRMYLRVFASPIFDADGEITHVLEAFTDITREILAEHARRESERLLHTSQRLEAIGSLAGGIAHDFNNLLAIVKLVAARLRFNEQDPERVELLGHLDEVADSAAKLTRSLLDFARRGNSLAEQVSLNARLKSVVALARRTFEQRFEFRDELQSTRDVIHGDPTQLEQLAMNLLMNARDSVTGRGSIVVRTRDRVLGQGDHPLLPGGHYVALEIEDTGSGIDPSVRERIFEPYVTTKNVGAVKGTGMGLATVYGIVKSHGGHVEVAFTSERGTCMRVWLPSSLERVVAAVPLERRVASAERGEGARVLVVDDEPLIRKTVALALEGLGFEVLPAASGEEAVAIVLSHRDTLSAALVDLSMPGMGGREAILELGRIAPSLPVLLMTGSALSADSMEVRELGVRELLPKPFSVEAVADSLARLVTRR